MTDPAPLDAFDPPKSYAFEPEFTAPAPRELPQSVRDGEYARKQRSLRKGLVVAGAACLLFARMAFVRRLGINLLPLAYLDWIGGAILIGAAASAVHTALKRGNFRYVIDGVPTVVRIVELQKVPFVRVNGQDSTYGFAAVVLVRHPDDGELKRFVLKSSDFPAGQKDRFDTPLRVGQYATAVYLPGKFDKSLRLYGFLELNPGLKFVVDAAQGPDARRGRVWALLGIIALFGALIGWWYSFSFFSLIRMTEPAFMWPSLGGGALIGIAAVAALWRRSREQARLIEERNRAAVAEGRAVEPYAYGVFARPGARAGVFKIFVALFIMLACAAPIATALLAANALLDDSAPELRPVRVVDLQQTTYSFLFRSYSVRYSWEDSDGREEFPLNPEELRDFFVGEDTVKTGFAEVHRGRLGWPWLKHVLPGVEEVRSH